MSKWRLAQQQQIVLLDTTVKTGTSPFAPTWDIVWGHKQGTVSDDEYTKCYRSLMKESWVQRRAEWMETLQSTNKLALACYCRPDTFCHRHLLKDMFSELCVRLEIPFHYHGELR